MTESEVIDAAREAGWADAKVFINGALPSKWEIYRDKHCMLLTDEMIMKLAAIIAAKQREKDARICERRVMGDNNREDAEAQRCANAIREQK